jgi:hypothetical protein
MIVACELEVDPVALHVGSDHMFNAVGEDALDFVSHEDGLAGAALGWIGSAQLSLGELAARWEVWHNQHKLQLGGLGSHVAEAMVSYVTKRGLVGPGSQIGSDGRILYTTVARLDSRNRWARR